MPFFSGTPCIAVAETPDDETALTLAARKHLLSPTVWVEEIPEESDMPIVAVSLGPFVRSHAALVRTIQMLEEGFKLYAGETDLGSIRQYLEFALEVIELQTKVSPGEREAVKRKRTLQVARGLDDRFKRERDDAARRRKRKPPRA